MDRNDLRSSLAALIDREFELAHRLSQALADESEALQQLDPGELDKATDAKQQCVSLLAGIDIQRRRFCVDHGLTPDREGIHAALAGSDGADGALSERWDSLLALLEACREANQRNGAVVSAQRRRVDDALGLLRGDAANASLYDAQGEIGISDNARVDAEI